MIKLLCVAVSAMVILFLSLFISTPATISIQSSVPPVLDAASGGVVSVIVTKGNLSGYARLQQILPHGCIASPVETNGAQFFMEDNVVKFIWIQLPSENSFTISYRIQSDPDFSGTQTVSGSFSYIEQDETKKIGMETMVLNFSSPSAVGQSKPEVERKIFAITPETGEYKVELTVHRKNEGSSARYIDNIPEGYSVTATNTNGGTFLFSNQHAEFIWTKLPDDSVFKISYNLIATTQHTEDPTVTGMLVYGDDAKEKSAVATNSTASAVIEKKSVQDEQTEKIAANLIEEEKEKSLAQSNNYISIPAPQKGIFYKVQIAATKRSPVRSDHFFQNKYHFDQHVDLTEEVGWRKYMLGNFDSYASASTFNTRVREKISDAFVVAYHNAERINVKQAMTMIERKGD